MAVNSDVNIATVIWPRRASEKAAPTRLLLSPMFIKEPRSRDFSRGTRGRRRSCVKHRPVRQLWRLSRVVQVVVFAKGKSTVEHYVVFGILGIGRDQHRNMRRRVEIGFFDDNLTFIPGYRKSIDKPA